MTIANLSKRTFLQWLAAQGATVALAGCGGGGSTEGNGSGGATGSLVITGTSNLPDTGTAIVPDAGLPTGAGTSTASTFTNLVDAAVNSIVNANIRKLSVPLAGTSPPAVGNSYAVVLDGANGGSALTLLVVGVSGNKSWYFSSLSGTVRITALSAASLDLLFTDVTLSADGRANNNSATGQVVLNGSITLRRV